MRIADFVEELGRPVAYYPSLAKLIGVKECIFLCQLLYWRKTIEAKGDEPREVYKSTEELENEIGFSYEEQLRVRKSLVKQGLLKERHSRLEHRLYFAIDGEILEGLWGENIVKRKHDFAKWAKPNCPNGQNPTGEQGKAHFVYQAETTTEKTTKEHPSKNRASLAVVVEYCKEQGLTEKDGEYIFNNWEGNGWTVSKKPIKDWRAVVRSWKAAEYFPSQRKQLGRNGKPIPKENYSQSHFTYEQAQEIEQHDKQQREAFITNGR